jgi:hypothetical protein
MSQWLLDNFSKGELQVMVFSMGIVLIWLCVVIKDTITRLRIRYEDYRCFKQKADANEEDYYHVDISEISTMTNKTISVPINKQTNG